MNTPAHVNLAHVREEHQKEVMERIVQDGLCPFCRENLEKYHTKPILFENAGWVVTENFAPYSGSVHHFLLVAREHCTTPMELPEESWALLRSTLAQLKDEHGLEGGTLLLRWGDTDRTGASVAHLHAQLVVGVSREENDTPILTSLGYQRPLPE
jgi:diadenosine tetraphosphate (Ap4A) HIT family hydrolase